MLDLKGALKLVLHKGSFVHDEIFAKDITKLDPFLVSCLKDIPRKVATDKTTNLLESHLQFPELNLLKVLVRPDTFLT